MHRRHARKACTEGMHGSRKVHSGMAAAALNTRLHASFGLQPGTTRPSRSTETLYTSSRHVTRFDVTACVSC